MTRSSSASRRRLERGQFSWVTLLLVLSVVIGGYLAVVWVPVYLVHQEVKQVTRSIINQAVKERNDELLVSDLCRRLARLDSVEGIDELGRTVQLPVVDVAPQDVTFERDTSVRPPTLRVAFEYVRVVRYPFLDREDEKVLSVDFTEEIGIPQW